MGAARRSQVEEASAHLSTTQEGLTEEGAWGLVGQTDWEERGSG